MATSFHAVTGLNYESHEQKLCKKKCNYLVWISKLPECFGFPLENKAVCMFKVKSVNNSVPSWMLWWNRMLASIWLHVTERAEEKDRRQIIFIHFILEPSGIMSFCFQDVWLLCWMTVQQCCSLNTDSKKKKVNISKEWLQLAAVQSFCWVISN